MSQIGFSKNTLIATPNGYTKISKLKKDDMVWSYTSVGVKAAKIQSIKTKKVDQIYKVVLEEFTNKSPIRCGVDQKWFKVNNKSSATNRLRSGSEIYHMSQKELRSMNNVSKRPWMKKLLSETMKKTNATGKIHSKLPQNQKGYVHNDQFVAKAVSRALKQWDTKEYRDNWERGNMLSKKKWKNRPTKLEKEFITFFKKHKLGIKYVGDNKMFLRAKDSKGKMISINPDFVINGQKKVLEVFTHKFPHNWEQRDKPTWMVEREVLMKKAKHKVLFIDQSELSEPKKLLKRLSKFIHNGLKIKSKKKVNVKEEILYSLKLKKPFNSYFVYRGLVTC